MSLLQISPTQLWRGRLQRPVGADRQVPGPSGHGEGQLILEGWPLKCLKPLGGGPSLRGGPQPSRAQALSQPAGLTPQLCKIEIGVIGQCEAPAGPQLRPGSSWPARRPRGRGRARTRCAVAARTVPAAPGASAAAQVQALRARGGPAAASGCQDNRAAGQPSLPSQAGLA